MNVDLSDLSWDGCFLFKKRWKVSCFFSVFDTYGSIIYKTVWWNFLKKISELIEGCVVLKAKCYKRKVTKIFFLSTSIWCLIFLTHQSPSLPLNCHFSKVKNPWLTSFLQRMCLNSLYILDAFFGSRSALLYPFLKCGEQTQASHKNNLYWGRREIVSLATRGIIQWFF